MSGDVVIRAEGLGKKYRIGAASDGARYSALRDVMAQAVRGAGRTILGGLKDRHPIRSQPAADAGDEFWALRDLSFEVRRGEVLGVIGRNGAGKSTLLKVLSRITEPTAGRVTIRGRIASLLEVGTGFHPELTGRENIFLNGAVLGMTRAEIRRRFDEIVAFAEVGKFIDTPVKRYSSGMYVRLAFAVAAHLEPEILIVDEVLAVGDAEFQKKCLGKMGEVSRSGSRTVLFVSHNLSAVRSLCRSAILIDRGRLLTAGRVAEVLAAYGRSRVPEASDVRERRDRAGNGAVRLARLAHRVVESPSARHSFSLDIDVHRAVSRLRLVVAVYDHDSQCILRLDSGSQIASRPERGPAGYTVMMPENFCLASKEYFVNFAAFDGTDCCDHVERAMSFSFSAAEHSETRGYSGRADEIVIVGSEWASA